MKKSLAVTEQLSLCFILLLRLCGVLPFHHDLIPLWQASPQYLDDVLRLAGESGEGGEDCLASITLDIVLTKDWWRMKWFVLFTFRQQLRQRWHDQVKKLPQGVMFPPHVLAALNVYMRRLAPSYHLQQFPAWYDVLFVPHLPWSTAEIDAALVDEEVHRQARLAEELELVDAPRTPPRSSHHSTVISVSCLFDTTFVFVGKLERPRGNNVLYHSWPKVDCQL